MVNQLINTKLHYVEVLEALALKNAETLEADKGVTRSLVEQLDGIYKAAQVEKRYEDKEFYESAYHTPVTGDFEFLVARTLHHFGQKLNLGWKVSLRKQSAKAAPDIRLAIGERTVGIVELKTKLGWVQPFFSSQQREKDEKRRIDGKSEFDPKLWIEEWKKKFDKYEKVFKVRKEYVYLLVPSLHHVHRIKSDEKVPEYRQNFASNSGLPEHNLVLLSDDLKYDPGANKNNLPDGVTLEFERMVNELYDHAHSDG